VIGRVMVWACPEPDCEEFDTLRWHDNCASLACAEEHHREAVQVQLVPLGEVKEARRIVAEAMVKHSANGSTSCDFNEWEPESQRLFLADVQAGLDALADATFPSDSEAN
jgi:hypothetical protein